MIPDINKLLDAKDARIAALESALHEIERVTARDGRDHVYKIAHGCFEAETETKSCGCDEVDGYLCGKNEDGLSCVCQCHTSKTETKL